MGLLGVTIALVGVIFGEDTSGSKKTKDHAKQRDHMPYLRKEDRAAATRRWRERKKIEKERETSSNLTKLAVNPSSAHVLPRPGYAAPKVGQVLALPSSSQIGKKITHLPRVRRVTEIPESVLADAGITRQGNALSAGPDVDIQRFLRDLGIVK